MLPAHILSNTKIDESNALQRGQDIAFRMSTINKVSSQELLHNNSATSTKELPNELPNELFVQANGFAFAGRHLLFDCWNASNLDDVEVIEKALQDAVVATQATLLHIHMHPLNQHGGIFGVAVLAESHISVHTWPERDYAALDIFMCGNANPALALPIFRTAFSTENIEMSEHMRGRQFTDMTPHANI